MVDRDTVDYRDTSSFDDSSLQDVQTIKSAILHKQYGKDVRSAIAQLPDSLIKLFGDTGGNSNAEVEEARGGFETLGLHEQAQNAGIDKVTVEVQNARTNSSSQTYPTLKERMDNQENYLNNSINDKLAKMNLQPETFKNEAALKAEYPNGKSGIMVTIDTGHKWIWADNSWKDFGTYQAVGLPDDELKVINNALHGETIVYDEAASKPPYNDLNSLEDNTIVTYATDITKILHAPENLIVGSTLGATVITANYASSSDGAGRVQFLITNNANQFVRVMWGEPAKYTEWNRPLEKRDFVGIMAFSKDIDEGRYTDLDKLPVNTTITYSLDSTYTAKLAHYPSKDPGTVRTISCDLNDAAGQFQICVDSNNTIYHRILWGWPSYWTPWVSESTEIEKIKPSISLFQNIGIIGDSYASGELYVKGTYTDHYDISWGQILARKNGIKALNFSKGGLTTRDWLVDDHGLSLLNSSDPQDLYIIALGINDYQKLSDSYLGAENDINTKANTFYGNYGKIISSIITKAPQAKIVLSTMSYDSQGTAHNYNEAIKTIAKHFGLPFIEQNSDPLFTSDLYLNHMVGGHPTAPVYASMAKAFERLIGQSMIDHLDYYNK